MTDLTDAELFCLRYLEREGATSGLRLCFAGQKHLGQGALNVRSFSLAIRRLRADGLTSRSDGNGFWQHAITPAGRAELERREGGGMKDEITLVCPDCEVRVKTPRCETDPPTAVELHGITCPACDKGGFDMPAYFDGSGNEICGDPDSWRESEG